MTLETKSQTPTILQVVPDLQAGGAEKTAVDVSIALKDLGWRPLIVSAGGRLVETLERHEIEHIQLPLLSKNPVTIWLNVSRLQKCMMAQKVDLVHARSRAPAWSAYLAAKRLALPFVTTYHGAYGQTNKAKAFYNSVMGKGDIVIGNSQWTADLVKERHPEAADRIVAIPRGTDFTAFQQTSISQERRAAIRKSWDVAPDDFVVLHLARLSSLKDQRTVIEAAATVAKQHKNFRIVFAGDAFGRESYREELVNRVAELGLEGFIRFPGHCADPAAALAVCDVAISASRAPETFGRVAVEAGALEKPVIVTDIGAVGETVLSAREVAANKRTGWKIEPQKPQELVKALLELIALPKAERDKIGKNARAYVTSRFSLDVMCEATIDVYKKLLQAKQV